MALVLELEKCNKHVTQAQNTEGIQKSMHVFLLKVIVLHGFAITTVSADFQDFLETLRRKDVLQASALLPASFDIRKSRSYIDQCIAYFLSM